jgi:DNA-nicking Smr family endonuclease
MPDRPLKPEEKKAWDQVRRSVRPLNSDTSARLPRATSAPSMSPTAPSSQAAPTHSGIVPPLHRQRTAAAPRNRGDEKTVRRGKIPISARLDLHGHTQASAWSTLPAFLAREKARGSRTVIIITGKGRDGSGLIRNNFLRWLEMPDARPLVSGYAQAHPRHGGSGAFYVFLRRR